jgi:hypothetical protein
MDRRSERLGVFASAFALAILLAFACHPAIPAAPAAGMSAPTPVRASFEASPAGGLPGSNLDWQPYALSLSGIAVAVASVRFRTTQPRTILTAVCSYAPLHRRPPPVLS